MGSRGPVRQRISTRNKNGEPIGLQAPSTRPVMPRGLAPDAQSVWRTILPILEDLDIVTRADAASLADFCLCLARLRQAEDDVTTRGILVPGEKEILVKNPALQIAKGYREALLKWSDRFCLTPIARARIFIPAKDSGPTMDEILSRPRPSFEERQTARVADKAAWDAFAAIPHRQAPEQKEN